MPYPREHAARMHPPTRYVRFRRENGKFGAGIDAIWGITKEGKVEIQAIRFSSSKFTVQEARKWLKEHNFKPILFEPATKSKGSKGEPNMETSAPIPEGVDPAKFRSCELQVTKKLMNDNPNLSHEKAKISAIRICIKQLKSETIDSAISRSFTA